VTTLLNTFRNSKKDISTGSQKYTFKFTQFNKAEYFAVKKTNCMTGI